jgi:serine/threonine-protein kinase
VGLGSDSTFAKGDRVDRFEIDELIAEGGMGAIYRAVDTKLRRTVALKVVRADRIDSTAGDQARQRFLREALAISKVDHRNVVRVLDFGFAGDTPYLAMEYLRGRDLGRVIKATPGFLPVAEVVDVMLGVCAAIRACHDVGIIHRDLKPSNVFLCDGDSEREVKILDFGVSKPPIASDLTREGQIIGTPQYLAPEQIDGKAVPQTDQYAIGVMLYAALTKALPYQNHASLGLLRAIVLGKFPAPRTLRADVPEALEGIILRAMRVAPAERFDSVHALGRELLAFASADAREKWRAYYLDDRLKAPPKASTHAMPLIEAMARGLSPATPSRDPAGFAATALAEPIVVKPETPSPRSAAPASAPTVSGGIARVPRAKRRPALAIVVAGGAVAVALVGWFSLRRPSNAEPPRVVVPTAAAPPIAPVSTTAPIQRQAPEPSTRAPEPSTSPDAEAAPPAPSERRHRRTRRAPADQPPADGVPIMP